MKCNEIAVFRYTWPGRDESYVCMEHAKKLKSVAEALGFYLQLIPISYPVMPGTDAIYHCQQNVKDE